MTLSALVRERLRGMQETFEVVVLEAERPQIGRIGVNLAQLERGLEKLGSLTEQDRQSLQEAYELAGWCAKSFQRCSGKVRARRVREARLRVRLSPGDWETISRLAAAVRRSRSQLVRASLELEGCRFSEEVAKALAGLLRSGRELNGNARAINRAVLARRGLSAAVLAGVQRSVQDTKAALEMALRALALEAEG